MENESPGMQPSSGRGRNAVADEFSEAMDRAEIVTGKVAIRQGYAVLFLNQNQKLHDSHGVETGIVKIGIDIKAGLRFEQSLADQCEKLLLERRGRG
jgi:hypothetical protein